MNRRVVFFLSVVFLASCRSPQIAYFQDSDDGLEFLLKEDGVIRLRSGDKVTVIVNTKDQEYNNMYNLPYAPARIGQNSSYQTAQGVACYTVDSDGCIEFPVLGRIGVEGMTREELGVYIKKALLDRKLLEDNPLVVTVEFANLNVAVLGEVGRPGRYAVDKDRLTLLDVLGMAGDLTIYGRRDGIVVVRQVGDKQKMLEVDLTSVESIANSPAYYVQQNDVVYVKPNSMRQRQATVSGNTVYTPTFWISVASLLTTLTAIIINN
ncbi:MAG: polysaccharide biosynthesis/export family protein [Bacteroidaceae bacterium]|nr:polysaccharide biosynthesis/export family protein [Bacteroidaceae bacterium]